MARGQHGRSPRQHVSRPPFDTNTIGRGAHRSAGRGKPSLAAGGPQVGRPLGWRSGDGGEACCNLQHDICGHAVRERKRRP